MGLQNFIVPWILYFTLPWELSIAGLKKNHTEEYDLEYSMSTTIKNVQTRLENSQKPNLVWTDFMTDRQTDFGQFRFGIGLGPDLSSNMNEVTSSIPRIRGTEKLVVTVTAESNRSDVRLVITSCKLVSKKNKSNTYFIQDGCLDNRMVESISREDNKMVFTLHLSGVQISSSSLVFISCEVKLFLNSNHTKSASSSCPLQLLAKQAMEPVLETRTYHITAKSIYVIWEARKKATTNYAAIVIGMVLGVTVIAVVVLLVRKSFSGVRRRNILMEL